MNNEIDVKNQREEVQKKYSNARSNLLLMIGLTLVNIILLLVGSDTMMLFSATVPYFVAAIGVGTEITELLIIFVAIAIAILIIYLLCWIFSKKHYGWMIVALVLFIIDSICMCGLYISIQDFSGILDVLIHIWVLYYLIIGVKSGAQLKKMPEEVIEQQISEPEIIEQEEPTEE